MCINLYITSRKYYFYLYVKTKMFIYTIYVEAGINIELYYKFITNYFIYSTTSSQVSDVDRRRLFSVIIIFVYL